MRGGADGSRGASHQGHQGALQLTRAGRLALNARLTAMIVEGLGGDLAAGIAVNAGGVHEEVAGGVLRQSLLDLCHTVWIQPGCGKSQEKTQGPRRAPGGPGL